MSFFIKNKGRSAPPTQKKGLGGKRRGPQEEVMKAKKKKGLVGGSEEIDSDSDGEKRDAVEYSSSDEEQETAQEKRLRLAKKYLAKLESEENDKASDEEFAQQAVAHRLKEDVLEQGGRLQKNIADTYIQPSSDQIRVCRGHQLPVTSVVISSDCKFIYSASKDCSIIKWCRVMGKKLKVVPGGRKGTEETHKGHTAHVLCLALTTDGKYLASGDRNKLIHVWNPDTMERVHTFTGHRDAVSGLAFRKGTHQLFSASHDRTVKTWNLDEMAYVETLFGHQDVITGIDSLTRERAISCGGRDKSLRIWKIIEESQLIFHGHSGCIDCVSLINEEHFVSGADDNSLAVWSVMKKKPVVMVNNAHSSAPIQSPEGSTDKGQAENWITAVKALTHTDLVASGSKDGLIRLWKCSRDYRKLTPLFSIPMVGFVNDLQFSADGSCLVAAVGQEHRLGRWWRMKEAKNSVCIIPLETKPVDPTQNPKENHRRIP